GCSPAVCRRPGCWRLRRRRPGSSARPGWSSGPSPPLCLRALRIGALRLNGGGLAVSRFVRRGLVGRSLLGGGVLDGQSSRLTLGLGLTLGLRLRLRLPLRLRLRLGSVPARPPQRGRGGDPADAGVAGPFDAVTGPVRAIGPRDACGARLLLVAVRTQALPVVRTGGPAAGDRLDVIALPDGGVAVRAAARGVAPGEEAPQRRREGASGR